MYYFGISTLVNRSVSPLQWLAGRHRQHSSLSLLQWQRTIHWLVSSLHQQHKLHRFLSERRWACLRSSPLRARRPLVSPFFLAVSIDEPKESSDPLDPTLPAQSNESIDQLLCVEKKKRRCNLTSCLSLRKMLAEREEHLSDTEHTSTSNFVNVQEQNLLDIQNDVQRDEATYQQVSSALRSISVTWLIRSLWSGAEIEDRVVDCVKERLQSNDQSMVFSSSSPFNGLRFEYQISVIETIPLMFNFASDSSLQFYSRC